MEQYISKTALVLELEKEIKKYSTINVGDSGELEAMYGAKCHALMSVLTFINTLEVKEVDNVWHDASETPKGVGDKEILVQFADYHASVCEIDDWEYLDHQTKWAYLKDLI